MIKRRISLILAILTIMTIMPQGSALTVFARSGGGMTTDISASPDDTGVMPQTGPEPEPSLPNTFTREEDAPAKEREGSLYTKTTDNGDGTKTLEVYGTPVKYRTEDGSVKDISLTPVRDGSGGYRTGDHRLSISFPEKADSGISLDTGKYVITATPVTENGTALKTASAYLSDTDAIVYRCDPKTSYEYNITYSGYKENIVVSEYTGQTDFLFRLETGGLKLSASSEGSHGSNLVLSNNDGTVVANIGDIIVFTSDNRNNTFGEISYETVTEDTEYILRISLSAGYLSDPDTHYPIFIDPPISVVYKDNDSDTWNDIEDITVNQNAAADSPSHVTLYAGKGSNTYGAMRAVMRFPDLNLYGIIPSNITSAKISMRDVMCYSNVLQIDCYGYGGTLPTGSFTTSNMTWSGINSEVQYYESSSRYRATNNVGSNNGINSGFWYEFDILPVVREWAQGTNAGTLAKKDQAVVFKSTDSHEQGSVSQYVCFGSFDGSGYRPYLTIQYAETYSGGNSFETATVIETCQQIAVNIATANEQKYFSFTPEDTGFYDFHSFHITASDPEGRLFNGNGYLLAEDDDIDPDNDDYDFLLQYHLIEDVTYFFVAKCGGNGTGSFIIMISESEAPSASLYAGHITLGTSCLISNSVGYEVNYFKISPTDSIELLLFSSDRSSDPYIRVYDSSMDLLTADDNGAGDSNFRATVFLFAYEWYYVVLGNGGNGTGSFRFHTLKEGLFDSCVYYIKNITSGLFVAVYGPEEQDKVKQSQWNSVPDQRWMIERQSDGYYTIKSEYGQKKYIGISSSATGTNNVKLFSSVSDVSRWKIYRNSNGQILFEPKAAPGKTLYSPDSNSGTLLQLANLCVFDSLNETKSEYYITTGYGTQPFRQLGASNNQYNCLQYALSAVGWVDIEDWNPLFEAYSNEIANYESILDDEESYEYEVALETLAHECKTDFENFIISVNGLTCSYDASFSGNGENTLLNDNQYRIVLRVGMHVWPPENTDCVHSDYHFWYQTKDGTWANKHGTGGIPVNLGSGVIPSTVGTSGWELNSGEGDYFFYNSQIFCYIITIG